MPKKKTGQRKKHDKMKARQKEIGKLGTKDHLAIVERPCNFTMECDRCQRRQKNRAFCYFCQHVSAKQSWMCFIQNCTISHLRSRDYQCARSAASRSACLRETAS